MSDKLQKLQELIKLTTESLTREEFLNAFKALTDFIKRTDAALSAKIDDKLIAAEDKITAIEQEARTKLSQIEADSDTTLSNVKKWALEAVVKLVAKSGINDKLKEVDDKLQELDQREWPNAQVITLEAAKMAQEQLTPLIPPKIDLTKELLTLGEPIRDSLELLEDGEKLEIEAIQDLRKELNDLRRMVVAKQTVISGGGGVGKHNMNVHDLSGSLDGVTKTFNLSAMWKVLFVLTGGSTPTAMRNGIDFTWTPTSITFTSEIDATTTLAAGQTILVVYAE